MTFKPTDKPTGDFRDRFIESQGQPIMHDGNEINRSFRLPVQSSETLSVSFRRAVDKPVQGVRLIGKGCSLVAAGERAPQFVLWADTAPERTEVSIAGAKKNAQVVLMNVWRDEKYGTTLHGLNCSGMQVIPQPDGTTELRCSDGWGDLDFNDLVLAVELTSGGAGRL